MSSNKKAIKVVEESIEASAVNKEINDKYIRSMEKGKHTLEKAYDAKLTVFMEAIEQTFNEKLLRITKSFDDKIHNMKLIIGSFKIQTQKQLNNLINAKSEQENNIMQNLNDHLPNCTRIKQT